MNGDKRIFNASGRGILAGLAASAVLGAFAGRAFYISPTSQGTLPTGWNKCPFVISKSQPKMFTGLVDSEGNATDVKLFLMIPATANYANSTRPFTGEAAEFEPMRSVVNNQSVCSTDPKVSELGLAESCIRARFEGLDPAKLYAFTFAAQRINGNTDDLSARYTVNGANSGAIIMNAYNCTNRVARLPGIAPLPDGSIEFSVEAAESNTYWKRFGYLTGLKLEEMDDLGDEDIYIDARTAPVSPSWTWNTVPMQSKGSYRGLLDRNGNQTRIGIDVAAASGSGNNSATLDLTGDAAEFNDARASNNAQVYFNKSSHGRATVLGLYPNCTYSFTFVASRADNDATKIYTTKYTVTGANSGSSTLDARNNATNVARVGGIRPTERGEAVIDIDPGDDCNVSWFYIMAFKITRETRYSSDMRAMTVDATAGGSVSATVAGMTTNTTCYLPADKTLVATATPDAGYRFVGWTSSFTNATVTTNPFTISAAPPHSPPHGQRSSSRMSPTRARRRTSTPMKRRQTTGRRGTSSTTRNTAGTKCKVRLWRATVRSPPSRSARFSRSACAARTAPCQSTTTPPRPASPSRATRPSSRRHVAATGASTFRSPVRVPWAMSPTGAWSHTTSSA